MNGSRQFAFQIHFDCDGHDVDTAASAKVDMAVSALVDAALTEVGVKKSDYRLRSAVPREGSFEATYFLQLLGDPVVAAYVTSAINLAAACLGSWIARDHDGAPVCAPQNSASVGAQLNVGHLDNLTLNASDARELWRDAACAIVEDGGISGLSVMTGGDVLQSLDREDIEALSVLGDDKKVRSRVLDLTVVAPVLSRAKAGVNQWKFECGGKSLNAVMADERFLGFLGEIAFRPEFSMRAKVSFLSEWDDKRQAYTPERAYVVKVFEAPGYRWERCAR